MYQRILVPVDASELSDRAIHASIDLARQLGAASPASWPNPSCCRPTGPISARRRFDATCANTMP
jgi:nucleotide-binding universal stress UspA family protein